MCTESKEVFTMLMLNFSVYFKVEFNSSYPRQRSASAFFYFSVGLAGASASTACVHDMLVRK